MSFTDISPEVARVVRAELVSIGTRNSRLEQHQRRRRALAVGIAAVSIVVATTGAALVVNSFPGSTTVTPLGGLHSATGTGTGTLELGVVPHGASRVVLTIRCLNSEGSISIESVPQLKGEDSGVTTFYCRGGGRVDTEGVVHPWHMNDARLPKNGSTSITITADAGTEWAISGRYASSSITPWAKNAQGETYGQCNVNGCPDLVGARASNGRIGFVFEKQEDAIAGDRFIPVYLSDGTTVIGKFPIGYPGSPGGSSVPTP